MQRSVKLIRAFFYICLLLCISLFITSFVMNSFISDVYRVNFGDELKLDSIIPITAEAGQDKKSVSSRVVGEKYTVDLKLFGVIPISQADVEVVDDTFVAVSGKPFGMKIYTDGILVIEVSAVDSVNGIVNPAAAAGVKVGDYIKSVNGTEISCNEDLSELVNTSGGEQIQLEINREGKTVLTQVQPVISRTDGAYKIGLWVRDSSAGIGTMTFYSPAADIICGLGHGICDSDTDCLLKVESGELVEAEIVGIKKGSRGTPGELKGKFTYNTIATISLNDESGVYGVPIDSINTDSLTEVALKQEIEDGKAQILCTVSGNTPKLYDCIVKKRTAGYYKGKQNMTVEITDEELLAKTGGIVQGLSGSPIIQNGKLIGAVTHVLIDDPTKGYGIFAENMLETARSVEELEEAG